jgi:hypothetical protein
MLLSIIGVQARTSLSGPSEFALWPKLWVEVPTRMSLCEDVWLPFAEINPLVGSALGKYLDERPQ